MQLNINIEFESEVITILVDDSFMLSARKNSEGKLDFKNFDKLDSEETEQTLKKVIEQLFTIAQE